jgi:hypothetical protein
MGAFTAQLDAPAARGLVEARDGGGGGAPGPGTPGGALPPAAYDPAAALTPGSSLATGGQSTRQSLGLAMMDSIVDEARLRHVSSKDELEAAFRRREVAVAALKAKMSKVRGMRLGGRVAGPCRGRRRSSCRSRLSRPAA